LLTDGLAVTSQGFVSYGVVLVDWSSNSESALVGKDVRHGIDTIGAFDYHYCVSDGTRIPNTVRRYEIHSYTYKFSIRVQRTYVRSNLLHRSQTLYKTSQVTKHTAFMWSGTMDAFSTRLGRSDEPSFL
jgi:hypothetical protein